MDDQQDGLQTTEISDREFITKPFRKWRDGRSGMAARDGTLAKPRKFPQC
jgi:hypothetical protein